MRCGFEVSCASVWGTLCCFLDDDGVDEGRVDDGVAGDEGMEMTLFHCCEVHENRFDGVTTRPLEVTRLGGGDSSTTVKAWRLPSGEDGLDRGRFFLWLTVLLDVSHG